MNLKKILLSSVQYSISAHNVQPFSFHFKSDFQIDIYVDPKRHLSIGDPHEKDLQTALGALFYTWTISLAPYQYSLKCENASPQIKNDNPYTSFIIFKNDLQINESDTYLKIDMLNKRFSYRGKFNPNENLPNRTFEKLISKQIKFITSFEDKKNVSKEYNYINLNFLKNGNYLTELYSWLRFNDLHPKWSIDGLNSAQMSLNSIEAFGAQFILKPNIFKLLNQLGIAQFLIDESPVIQSAPLIVGIYSKKSISNFEKGIQFMKNWLDLTELNLYGAPLSLLTDDPESLEKMNSLFELESNESLINILKCGLLPENYSRPHSSRRSEEDLLWKI